MPKSVGSIFIRGCIGIGKQSNGLQINDEIRFQKVRLIESDGSMIGVVTIAEARKRAEDQDLDLVLIAPQADNPVCKIMKNTSLKTIPYLY